MTQTETTPETTTDVVGLTLQLNGRERDVRVRPDEPLLEALRDSCGQTSVRGTCGIGVCGTCTVLIDGRVASSCIMLARQAVGREVTTAEGLLGADGELSQVQQAFVRNGAYQCSFCIPAMTLAVHAALQDPDVPSDRSSVREYLAGNLCRCGTYPEILQAVSDLVDDAAHDRTGGDR